MKSPIWLSGLMLIWLVGCRPEPVSTLIWQESYTARDRGSESLQNLRILTRADAFRIALANNPTFQATAQSIVSAEMRLKQAYGAYSPQLSVATTVGQQLYDDTGTVHESGNAFYSFTNVGASWMIFDGLAREFKMLSARRGVEEEKAQQANARRILLQAVSNAYDQILLAEAQLAIADADVTFQDQMCMITQKKYQAGTAARSDLLNFQSKRNNAIASQVQARFSRVMANEILAVLLGCEAGTLPDDLELDAPDAPVFLADPVEAALDKALAARPDLAAFRAQLKTAEYNLYTAYGAYLPTLMTFANYSYSSNSTDNSGNNANGFANFYLAGSTFSYGALAELQLFTGLTRYHKVREQQAKLASMEYQGAEKWLEVVQEVRAACHNIERSDALVKIYRENRDILREQRDLVAKSYLAGEDDLSRLNQAQDNYVTGEQQFQSALLTLSQSRAQYLAAIAAPPDNVP